MYSNSANPTGGEGFAMISLNITSPGSGFSAIKKLKLWDKFELIFPLKS